MAAADGEEPEMTLTRIEAHLAECAECRAEIESLVRTSQAFASYRRRAQYAEVWDIVESRLTERAAPVRVRRDIYIPLALAALFALYKIVELLPDHPPAAGIVLLPLVAGIALFILLKQNPFTITTGVFSEGV